MATAKASKKKKAPEDEGRGGEKKRRVGDPPKGPSVPVVDVASSRSSGDGGAQDLAPEQTQRDLCVAPEAREGVPPASTPTRAAPPAREASSPRIPAGSTHSLRIQSGDKGKRPIDSAQGSIRKAPSASSWSSGGQSAPRVGQGASGGGPSRVFHFRPRGENWELKALLKGDDSVLRDPLLAYDFFNNLILPQDRKDLEGWSNRKLVEQLILSGIQVRPSRSLLLFLNLGGRFTNLAICRDSTKPCWSENDLPFRREE